MTAGGLSAEAPAGRVAQRRRTRKAIVEATMRLLAEGQDPSINEIALAADVSRRTVYVHFPTLDQLILDATLGLMNLDVDDALAHHSSDDPCERVQFLVDSVMAGMEESLPLGRRMIKLTVGAAHEGPGPRRGQRRVGWIEWAVDPLRVRLAPQAFEDLVSALCTVIGWEPFIVLTDIRGLAAPEAAEITRRSATAIVEAVIPHATQAGATARPSPRAGR